MEGGSASSLFARRFAHVEIDDSVDLGQFARLDREVMAAINGYFDGLDL